MTRRGPTIAAALVAAVAVAGCGSSSKSSSSSGSTKPKPTKQKLSAPKIGVAFKSPKPNAKTGKTVTAVVTLTNFKLDPQDVGKAPKPGKGHLHFTMDGGKFDFPKYSGVNGKLAKKLGVAGKYSPSLTPKITYKGLPKGKHSLKVALANNDHSNAGASASVKFTVK
jgi:hypothetical protein